MLEFASSFNADVAPRVASVFSAVLRGMVPAAQETYLALSRGTGYTCSTGGSCDLPSRLWLTAASRPPVGPSGASLSGLCVGLANGALYHYGYAGSPPTLYSSAYNTTLRTCSAASASCPRAWWAVDGNGDSASAATLPPPGPATGNHFASPWYTAARATLNASGPAFTAALNASGTWLLDTSSMGAAPVLSYSLPFVACAACSNLPVAVSTSNSTHCGSCASLLASSPAFRYAGRACSVRSCPVRLWSCVLPWCLLCVGDFSPQLGQYHGRH